MFRRIYHRIRRMLKLPLSIPEIQAAFDRVTYCGMLKQHKCKVGVRSDGYLTDNVYLTFVLDGIPMRDDDTRIDYIAATEFIPRRLVMDVIAEPKRLADYVRNKFRILLLHELDECLLLDGQRIFDPHAGEGAYP